MPRSSLAVQSRNLGLPPPSPPTPPQPHGRMRKSNSQHQHLQEQHEQRRSEDYSIRRGAALIREEISRQFNMFRPPTQQQQQQQQHEEEREKQTPIPQKPLDRERGDHSSEERSEFSDLWLNPLPASSPSPRPSSTSQMPKAKVSPVTPGNDLSSLDYSFESQSAAEDARTFASKGDASQWAKGSVLISPEQLDEPYSLLNDNRKKNHDENHREQRSTITRDAPTERSCDTPVTTMGRDRNLTVKMKTYLFDSDVYEDELPLDKNRQSARKNHNPSISSKENNGYDFIQQDYVDEFELDDYDEVCHPLYSRKEPQRPVLQRNTAPPVSTQPARLDAPKKRTRPKTPSPQKQTTSSTTTSESTTTRVVSVDNSGTLLGERRQGPPSPSSSRTSGDASTQPSLIMDETPDIPSPLDVSYDMLLKDPAFRHAQQAGHLWQSLVGHHIRFPSHWWNGARAPPLGMEDFQAQSQAPWEYLGRFASHDKRLRRFVQNRAAPGRLLLHIVMLDLVTCKPQQDIVVGCFHPSARGIRTTADVDHSWDGVRDLWLAVRKRAGGVSVMDPHLNLLGNDERPSRGPLGRKQKVTNGNLRAVFGEEPPVETLFVPESYLYELYVAALKKHNHAVAPPLVLLQEFVFA